MHYYQITCKVWLKTLMLNLDCSYKLSGPKELIRLIPGFCPSLSYLAHMTCSTIPFPKILFFDSLKRDFPLMLTKACIDPNSEVNPILFIKVCFWSSLAKDINIRRWKLRFGLPTCCRQATGVNIGKLLWKEKWEKHKQAFLLMIISLPITLRHNVNAEGKRIMIF